MMPLPTLEVILPSSPSRLCPSIKYWEVKDLDVSDKDSYAKPHPPSTKKEKYLFNMKNKI